MGHTPTRGAWRRYRTVVRLLVALLAVLLVLPGVHDPTCDHGRGGSAGHEAHAGHAATASHAPTEPPDGGESGRDCRCVGVCVPGATRPLPEAAPAAPVQLSAAAFVTGPAPVAPVRTPRLPYELPWPTAPPRSLSF